VHRVRAVDVADCRAHLLSACCVGIADGRGSPQGRRGKPAGGSPGAAEGFEVEIPCQPSEIRTNGAGKRETREIVDYRLNRPAIKLGEWQVAGHLEFLADARTHDDIPVGLCG
jgi:hypothetical protein